MCIIYMTTVKKNRASNRMLTAGLCGFRRRLDEIFFLHFYRIDRIVVHE